MVIGTETDDPRPYNPWTFLENLFLLVFVIGFALRLFVLRGGFLTGPDYFWNGFDVFVVLTGVLDTLAEAFQGASAGVLSRYSTLFRVLRLLRILRICRLFKALQQLYVRASGLVESTVAVLWASLLTLFGIDVCAVVLVGSLGQMAQDTSRRPEVWKFYRDK